MKIISRDPEYRFDLDGINRHLIINEKEVALWLQAAIDDAKRYRWLLEHEPQEFLSDITGINCWNMSAKIELDAVIDAAMKKEEANGQS